MDDLGFELLASSLRADLRDLGAFTEALAAKLEGSLPAATTVERKRAGLLSGERRVHRITVNLDDAQYSLTADRGKLEPRKSKIVRGIVLKSEELPLEAWIDDLSQALAAEAGKSEQARLALERLLEQ